MKETPPTNTREVPPQGKEAAGETEMSAVPTEKKDAVRKGLFYFLTAVAYAFGIGVPGPLVSLGIPGAGGDAMGRGMARFFSLLVFSVFWTLCVLLVSTTLSRIYWDEWAMTLCVGVLSLLFSIPLLHYV